MLSHLRKFPLIGGKKQKKVHSPAHLIKLHFHVFRFGSEYARTLSAKNLLVWDKDLRRGSVGTSKRREFE